MINHNNLKRKFGNVSNVRTERDEVCFDVPKKDVQNRVSNDKVKSYQRMRMDIKELLNDDF